MKDPKQERAELERIVDEACGRLAEHFDAVEILCSRVEEGATGTRCIKRGVGNWYARQGMAQEFISLTRANEIADRINQTTGEA